MKNEAENFDDEIMMPLKAQRKLDNIFRENPFLKSDKILQEKIRQWAKALLSEAREEWTSMHNMTVESIIHYDRKEEAKKRGQCRDKQFAPFREYYKKIQRQKYVESQNNGKKLTANNFAIWFLQNKAQDIKIPYKESNQLSKLIKLAQENNREFRYP